MYKIKILFLFLIIILLNSCLGISLDISLNSNGSGNVDLEYRISKSLDSLGRLDGNERWNTIPVGRADFERTLDRLNGIKLLSFSSKDEERDIIINARMEFETIHALLSFLDSQGRQSFYEGDANSGILQFTLSEGSENNIALDRLAKEIFDTYMVNISMRFPNGRRTSFSFPIYEILTSSERMTVEFNW